MSYPHDEAPAGATALVMLADGTIMWGDGFGAVGHGAGELCFNTAMTGYQEVLTDPSYAGQIVTFTFPHIGNVGANPEDVESIAPGAVGCIVRDAPTAPSNWRATATLPEWMASRGIIGISGLDTRALTRRIRTIGAPDGVIAHAPDGRFDMPAIRDALAAFPGLNGLDLAPRVTRTDTASRAVDGGSRPHVVAIDYGAKDQIFRNLEAAGARVTVVPADTPHAAIMALRPDGVFLSNGPGDPAATGAYAVPVIQALLADDVPLFGICLGHQLLGLAAGARTIKMDQGHRGANHPVRRHDTGAIEITAMNHGFAIDGASLPDSVEETHRSLFDQSNCGIRLIGKRAFGVQYHPEASPGPRDSFYLFEQFVGGLAASDRAGAH